ncbi:NAD-dependent succinate-semialdehyde dehydrogenase [Brevibacterium jeotgali]|uniref:Succinate-semialdehyde dehydrogenase / glutarate-semialdehyde dehydrogenase n=1 Tax=Brevibacterium jeotgali TaxID=1262550 RepID=A0A2H1L3X3_9MICO|nr:NAD-dependent succinate-semialdehyde dehydrogenase [Brevibacterium jeotgali]TWC01735.1 succinate-semialdehyde dehydrogenase/glutarate-semialdehyde dehydrogenase [Brevibacterium jeotgali]SMY11480.1 succinate-semialdehyde dehydrogenase / glutarate-semialdehyde dehydrogenase [Brevibacterium jeotgali]
MSQGYRVEDPATGTVVEQFDTIADAQLDTVLATAAEAQTAWAAKSIEERAEVIRRVADLFAERKDNLAAIIGQEMGKRVTEGVEEAEFAGDIFRYYADNAARFAADQPIETDGGDAMLQRLPVGVLLGIMPWNFPYYQVARFAAPNLMLGNGIVLKHAEICPRSAAAIQDILVSAGVPEGLYTTVYADHEQIAAAIADPRIAGVSLTGSERAGAQVAAQAGRHLKKAVLELGGSDPYVVLDTDDVAEAAQTAWATRMYNTGQACNSNKRLIVMDDIYDDFVAELTRLAQGMTPGAWADEDESVYQPLSSRPAAEKLVEQLKRARDAGAVLQTGGELAADGAYVSPAVLTDVPVGSEIYYEELFGPVATVFRVSSDDEALRLANDSQFGLGGAVFSTDEARAKRVASGLEVGMANVNTPAGEGAELPFGGVKRSGYGRELGPVGMDEFVNKRLYYVEG